MLQFSTKNFDDEVELADLDPLVGLPKRVMRRVYLIYTVRQFNSPLIFKTTALGAFVIFMTSWVSFGDVFMNFYSTSGFVGTYKFFYSAFMDAEWNVEILCAAVVLLAVWIGNDLAKNIASRVHLSTLLRLQPRKA